MATSVDSRLAVIADHVDRYREQIGSIAQEPELTSSEDLVSALFEAERALRSAARALTLARTFAR